MIVLLNPVRVLAANIPVNGSIILDGSFDDWNGKPYVIDTIHDTESTGEDFLEVRYFTDDRYLYMDVERQSASKSKPWHFYVVMLNAAAGKKQVQYPYGMSLPIYAPQFSIEASFAGSKSQDGALVNVGFDGESIEETYSSSNDGKKIEFRVPLQKVGLDGKNKIVIFMLKSFDSGDGHDIDWVPNGRPIIITTGPTLWELSSILFYAAVSYTAYKVYKRLS